MASNGHAAGNGHNERFIEVRDERRQPFHIVDKLVTWFWLPFIGERGYALYNLYISLVNHKTGGAFPSIRRVAAFLDCSPNTVRKYNRLLEQYGLIRIEERRDPLSGDYASHMYYILDPPDLPAELQAEYHRRRLVDSDLMARRERPDAGDRDDDEGGGSVNEPPPSGDAPGPDRGSSAVEPPHSAAEPPASSVEAPGSAIAPPGSATAAPGSAAEAKREQRKENKEKRNNTAPTAEPDVVVSLYSQERLKHLLREIGVHARRAARLVREHDPEQIATLHEYMLYLIGQGRGPENPAAWLATAIEEQWDVPPSVARGRKQERERARMNEELARLGENLDAARRREAEQFRRQQQELMDQLEVAPRTREAWRIALDELRARGAYSPVYELAFLVRVEGEAALIQAQTPLIQQILEREERLEAIRAALRKALGTSALYLTITSGSDKMGNSSAPDGRQ